MCEREIRNKLSVFTFWLQKCIFSQCDELWKPFWATLNFNCVHPLNLMYMRNFRFFNSIKTLQWITMTFPSVYIIISQLWYALLVLGNYLQFPKHIIIDIISAHLNFGTVSDFKSFERLRKNAKRNIIKSAITQFHYTSLIVSIILNSISSHSHTHTHRDWQH